MDAFLLRHAVSSVNEFPISVKNATIPKSFKARLKSALVSVAFYNAADSDPKFYISSNNKDDCNGIQT